MKSETKDILELIVEKSSKLNEFGFAEHARETGLAFRAILQEDGTSILEFDLPDEEKRDAFLLHFRMFHQRNESISFQNLPELFKDQGLSKDWVETVKNLKKIYDTYLDDYSQYSVNLFDGQPTRREMLQTGLYGGLAHANNHQLVNQYKNWTKDDVRLFVFQQEFSRILVVMQDLIDKLGEISKIELEK